MHVFHARENAHFDEFSDFFILHQCNVLTEFFLIFNFSEEHLRLRSGISVLCTQGYEYDYELHITINCK